MSQTPSPEVGIVMGSDSDLATMQAAADALSEFGIGHELRVVSAHRAPRDMIEYGTTAHERGLRVIIAGAGGAAHLPGMLAAATALPVIGVPVALTHLQGMDSLLSIVQMPDGVPVATVGIGNARNAGLLAVRILAVGDPERTAAVLAFQERLLETSREKDSRVRSGSGLTS
jgi:5-(carboxyamino)imidazole ribonucleotide mutase